MAVTANLGLTLLASSDTGKVAKINDNARWLDVLTQAVAIAWQSSPPASPAEGDCYLVSSSPTGAWSGFAENDVAAYINGAWDNRTPEEGWLFKLLTVAGRRYFNGSTWTGTGFY